MDLVIFTEVQEEIADRIYDARKYQKLTQKDMCERTGIPLSTYQRLEQEGEGSLKNFAKILIALGRHSEIKRILNVPTGETPMEVYERMKNG